jgi:calcium/calmodulin-dependent protein kinase (CaM kinase) II
MGSERSGTGTFLATSSMGSFFSNSSLGTKSFEKQPSLANFVPNRSVKIVDLRMKPKNIARLTQHEAEMWKNIGKHNHVVQLINVRAEFGMCFFIMEMCSASLLHYLSSVPLVDERKLGETFAQMLLGIEFLHRSKIAHRDIKPDHFVVGGDSGHTIKLGDFALATFQDEMLTGECGTALYMAPEMVLHRGYDLKVDVWSFGVIVYALLLGHFPYDVDEKDSEGVKQTIASAKDAPSFKAGIPITPTASSFAKSLLCRNPKQRPSANAALKSIFMIDIITQSHEVHNDLPNLKAQLHHVKKLRAFQNKDLVDKSEIDDILNRQQLFVHGLPLPGMKEQSIVVQKLGTSRGLEEHHKSKKRNSFLNSEDSEKLGFVLGEKVKCIEATSGIVKGQVGHVVGFSDCHVHVEFAGTAPKKLKPSQLKVMVARKCSSRNSNFSSHLSKMSKSDSLASLVSTQVGSPSTGSPANSVTDDEDDSSTSLWTDLCEPQVLAIETCDVKSENSI